MRQAEPPTPTCLCNREVKFDLFLDAALKLGADAVATGHYCRKTTDETGVHHLLAGADGNKDQSYFLCQLNQAQLSRALFPIGELQKPEVRQLAHELALPTADKKDSQGLCFIGKVRLPDFLQQQLQVKRGDIVEVSGDHPVFDRDTTPRWKNARAPLPWHRKWAKSLANTMAPTFSPWAKGKGCRSEESQSHCLSLERASRPTPFSWDRATTILDCTALPFGSNPHIGSILKWPEQAARRRRLA